MIKVEGGGQRVGREGQRGEGQRDDKGGGGGGGGGAEG